MLTLKDFLESQFMKIRYSNRRIIVDLDDSNIEWNFADSHQCLQSMNPTDLLRPVTKYNSCGQYIRINIKNSFLYGDERK